MTLDDELALSAYLDGELSPDEARAVERAAAADPAVAARLVALATTSEAVAGLSRCASPCGLASTVLARIDEPPRRRAPFWLATAASVAFAFLLAAKSGLLPTGGPAVKDVPRVVRVDRPKGPVREVDLTNEPDAPDPIDLADPPIAADPLGPIVDPAEPARRAVVELIDRPGLRRVVVPIGAGEPGAADRVAEILREMGRKDPAFGRVSVPAGLAIDPAFPDEAEVFAATMDGPEFDQFVVRLGKAFGEVVLDTRFDPALAMQLAELGRISVGTGPQAAGLGEPPVDPSLAEKAGPASIPPAVETEPADPTSTDPVERALSRYQRDRAMGRLERTEPVSTSDEPRSRPSPATGPTPVLIWVTTKARG